MVEQEGKVRYLRYPRFLTRVGSFAGDLSVHPLSGVGTYILDTYRIVSWRLSAGGSGPSWPVSYSMSNTLEEYVQWSTYLLLPIVRPPENLASGMRRGTQRARASAAGFARFRLLAPDDKCIRFRGASQRRPVTWACSTSGSELHQ